MPNLKLKYIIDENGDRVAPITHIDAVRNSNGDSLTSLMAPEKLGFGIGTCSTSSGTALTVTLTGYELVQNGFVAVTFENDVPANATLNINSKGAKPIMYKGDAIESDTIKADDTVMFSYDGTNYVVTSLGGGGVNPNETVIISLTQTRGYDADLIGATITIIDENNEILYNDIWNGYDISTSIAPQIVYTVVVGDVNGYITPSSKSSQSLPFNHNYISFSYICKVGVFIESTDGGIYTKEQWMSINNKTPNSLVILTDNSNFRLALYEYSELPMTPGNINDWTAIDRYVPQVSVPQSDYNGKTNTQNLVNFNASLGQTGTNSCVGYAQAFTFPNGQKNGYVLSSGQFNIIYLNLTEVNACFALTNGSPIVNSRGYYTSSGTNITAGGFRYLWGTANCGNTFDRAVSGGWSYYTTNGYFRIGSDYTI